MCAPFPLSLLDKPLHWFSAGVCLLRGGHDWHESSFVNTSWVEVKYNLCWRCGRAIYPDGRKGWQE